MDYETIKQIIVRLNGPRSLMYLCDLSDGSKIVIDNELLTIIRKYYENELINKE